MFAIFFLPTALYLILGHWESIHLFLDVFVMIFVGMFYITLFFGIKVVFHGSTVLVMKVSKKWRSLVQVIIPFLLFPLDILVSDIIEYKELAVSTIMPGRLFFLQ